MKFQKRLRVHFKTPSPNKRVQAQTYSEADYLRILKTVYSSTVEQLDDDKLNSSFQNSREVKRDKSVTDLLALYVKSYELRQIDNRNCRKCMFYLCLVAVSLLILTSIISILFSLICTDRNVNDIVALVTACMTVIGSIAFLLEIIAKYVFPSNEEDNIAKMVQAVQKNDLEERKLRYKHQQTLKNITSNEACSNEEGKQS